MFFPISFHHISSLFVILKFIQTLHLISFLFPFLCFLTRFSTPVLSIKVVSLIICRLWLRDAFVMRIMIHLVLGKSFETCRWWIPIKELEGWNYHLLLYLFLSLSLGRIKIKSGFLPTFSIQSWRKLESYKIQPIIICELTLRVWTWQFRAKFLVPALALLKQNNWGAMDSSGLDYIKNCQRTTCQPLETHCCEPLGSL